MAMKSEIRKFGISDKRGRAVTRLDPYIAEAGLREPARCLDCGALYRNKRWSAAGEVGSAGRMDGDFSPTSCPACRKMAEGFAEGVVTLGGAYLWAHEGEILNILRNEEHRAMARNPLERIMRMEREGDELIIETTEEKLAEHLGRTLRRAHRGELHVSWDADHDFCRVRWQRAL